MMVRYCNVSMFNRNGFVEAICMPIWIILMRSQDYIYVYELREHHTIVVWLQRGEQQVRGWLAECDIFFGHQYQGYMI